MLECESSSLIFHISLNEFIHFLFRQKFSISPVSKTFESRVGFVHPTYVDVAESVSKNWPEIEQ